MNTLKDYIRPVQLRQSSIESVLGAVKRANRRAKVGLGSFKVFPMSPDEAKHPQIVRRPKR